MTPGAYLERLLGPEPKVVIGDRTVDLLDEVAIPEDVDLEHQLREHAVRVAAWRKLRAKAARAKSRLLDELKELEALRFVHYYRVHEEQERLEWEQFYLDETDVSRDAFGRSKVVRGRLAKGEKALPHRWRRNFSDELVWAFVRSDDEVSAKRAELRKAAAQFELADGLCEALDHRARCLSHLAALHRDLGRSG